MEANVNYNSAPLDTSFLEQQNSQITNMYSANYVETDSELDDGDMSPCLTTSSM